MTWQQKGKYWCGLSCVLFLVALGVLIASSIAGNFSGSTTVFQGSCSVAGNVNVGIHIAITIYSTLIALSSDFFMRLVSAPQPDDIDQAHREAQWMDVGINSLRNWKFIPLRRRGLWLLCIISSIPLQLFSQASVYSTATSTDYNQLLVSKGFAEGEPFALPGAATLEEGGEWRDDQAILEPLFQSYQNDVAGFNWHRLDSLQCQQMYLESRNGLQYYRNLIIVIEAGPDVNATGWTDDQIWNGTIPPFFNNTSKAGYSPSATNSLWSFSTGCSVGDNVGDTWNVCGGDFGTPVQDTPTGSYSLLNPWQYQWLQSEFDVTLETGTALFPTFDLSYNNITALYCIAEPFESPCKVQVTNLLLLPVCVCVLLKCFFAITTLFHLRKAKPMQCLGDAIGWFLEHGKEEQATAKLCTYGQKEFRSRLLRDDPNTSVDMRPKWTGRPRQWAHLTKRWGTAVPLRTWLATYLPIIGVIVLSLGLLIVGIDHNTFLGGGLFSEAGFGSNPNNSRFNPIYGDRFRTSLVANLPQLILSSAYFTFSSLYSGLFQARDWAAFAEKPQRLKVTDPEDGQESSYPLHIPTAWGVTFTGVSATLHWLVSQSLYVVAVEVLPSYSGDGLAEPLSFYIAYSTEAILVTIILAFVALSIPLLLALLPLSKESIIVGTNSAAISAQCHRLRTRGDPGRDEPGRNSGSSANGNLGQNEDDGARPAESEIAFPAGDNARQPAAHQAENSDAEAESLDRRSKQGNFWLYRLKWGVLRTGTEDSPGHLGLDFEWGVRGLPKEGHFYE